MSSQTPISERKTPNVGASTTYPVALALGSNLGDRRSHLAAAIQRLRNVIEVERLSSVYETEPVGYLEQPSFLNMVLIGHTSLTPDALLHFAKLTEQELGRQPSFRNGPRPIDIDILFYAEQQFEQEHLTIPHPRLRERAFVLIPLAEIAPDLHDPLTGLTSSELLHNVSPHGVKKLADDLRISLERDIQNSQPQIQVSLGRAGVTGLKKALLLGETGNQRWLEASFDLYASLDAHRAGVHMSRFSDVLEEVIDELAEKQWPQLDLFAEELAKTLVERQHVLSAEASIRTSYPLQKWTPVSGRRTQEIYGLLAKAVATPQGSKRLLGVEVWGMVACPCAQDMIHTLAQVRLQEEGFPEPMIKKMLEVTPLATHNQRGKATLFIGSQSTIEPGEIIALVESAMSSENYALLKRPDELYIVNKAHSNPRFVEDVVREVLGAIVDRYPDLSDQDFVWVRQQNEETIHKYDVVAEGWGTMGELRAEILHQQTLGEHTSQEAWLRIIASEE